MSRLLGGYLWCDANLLVTNIVNMSEAIMRRSKKHTPERLLNHGRVCNRRL